MQGEVQIGKNYFREHLRSKNSYFHVIRAREGNKHYANSNMKLKRGAVLLRWMLYIEHVILRYLRKNLNAKRPVQYSELYIVEVHQGVSLFCRNKKH